ncbi:YdcF family protein [Peribacillus sp. SCS-155]|uniref:YdcF family protein n=1 Tax=Peribacillus sedimenti TaxID=3115297 RepID=UPI00390639F8
MRKKRLNRFPIFLGFICILGALYIGVLHVKIYQHAHVQTPESAEYLIILGARVRGAEPSLALQYRINASAAYLKHNKRTIAIASGGKGTGEDISEAAAIKAELVKQGIAESRIILEDNSTDTYQNIRFSKELLSDPSAKGIIATNDFHMYRALHIAKNENLDVSGLPAKTPASALLKSYIREYLAITKYYLMSVLK